MRRFECPCGFVAKDYVRLENHQRDELWIQVFGHPYRDHEEMTWDLEVQ